MDLIKRIRDKMMKDRLMFVYRGVVTTENTISLLMLLEKEMESSEFGFTGRKRLFMFVLESLQNISRHMDKNEFASMSLVVYSKTDKGYIVATGNVIESERIEDLREKLEKLNKLEPGEIRAVYRHMLSSAEFSSKGGAGLGLIEMAKKTGNRLDYDFINIDRKHSYFILNKSVESGESGTEVKEDNTALKGRAVARLEKIMAENNLYLIWSGHFSPDLGNEVLSFTEIQLSETTVDSDIRRRVFTILMEALENVARYSPSHDQEEKYGMPVAMIRLEGHVYLITTGNIILNDDIPALREKLDIINSCDKLSLKELFKKSLLKQSLDTESTGNMGLIEIAMKSGYKLMYDFDRINGKYSYYILTVKVDEHND
jgi:hypothetical protein